MLRVTALQRRRRVNAYPVPPVTHIPRSAQAICASTNPYGRMFWRYTMTPDLKRPSFWSSDFRHRYLVKTGTDYHGRVPGSPAPGHYQGFADTQRVLARHPKPQRESRHLPVMPMTPRVVYEHAQEKRIDFAKKMRYDRRRIEQMKTHEFWAWYTKLQRVRGRWCREQGIASRGVYGPAVDAAELWG